MTDKPLGLLVKYTKLQFLVFSSRRGMCRGVVGKIREAGQGDSRGGKMVVVELAPVAKACEVGRETD